VIGAIAIDVCVAPIVAARFACAALLATALDCGSSKAAVQTAWQGSRQGSCCDPQRRSLTQYSHRARRRLMARVLRRHVTRDKDLAAELLPAGGRVAAATNRQQHNGPGDPNRAKQCDYWQPTTQCSAVPLPARTGTIG